MCKMLDIIVDAFSQQAITNTAAFTLTAAQVQAELLALGCRIPFGMLDGVYYGAKDTGWYNIFIECFKNLPAYETDRMDCDKFAFIFKTRVLQASGLNSFAFVVGDIPVGRHGFNMYRDQNGWHLLEPNPGFMYGNLQCFEIGENGYKPDEVLL